MPWPMTSNPKNATVDRRLKDAEEIAGSRLAGEEESATRYAGPRIGIRQEPGHGLVGFEGCSPTGRAPCGPCLEDHEVAVDPAVRAGQRLRPDADRRLAVSGSLRRKALPPRPSAPGTSRSPPAKKAASRTFRSDTAALFAWTILSSTSVSIAAPSRTSIRGSRGELPLDRLPAAGLGQPIATLAASSSRRRA